MPSLMATAEYVTKVHAVCVKTGNLANYSHRTIENEELVVLGEIQEYQPLSRAAYYKAIQEQQEKALAQKKNIKEKLDKTASKLKNHLEKSQSTSKEEPIIKQINQTDE